MKHENGFAFGLTLLRPLRNSLRNPEDLRPGAENHPANYCNLLTLGAVISACVYPAVCLCLVISKTSPIFAVILADLTKSLCLTYKKKTKKEPVNNMGKTEKK